MNIWIQLKQRTFIRSEITNLIRSGAILTPKVKRPMNAVETSTGFLNLFIEQLEERFVVHQKSYQEEQR